MSLAFIVKNNNSKFDEYLSQQSVINNISFNSDKIKVSNFSIVKSLSYKDNAYYFLNLKLKPIDDFNDAIKIDSINLGDNIYNIGELTFNLAGNYTGDLKIESAKALSFGVGLTDFSALIKNSNTSEKITLVKVDSGQLTKFNPEIILKSIKETIFTGQSDITINPNETVEIIVRFDEDVASAYDVFYFSPLIQYRDATGIHNMYFDYYSAGLNISMDEFKSIVSK